MPNVLQRIKSSGLQEQMNKASQNIDNHTTTSDHTASYKMASQQIYNNCHADNEQDGLQYVNRWYTTRYISDCSNT